MGPTIIVFLLVYKTMCYLTVCCQHWPSKGTSQGKHLLHRQVREGTSFVHPHVIAIKIHEEKHIGYQRYYKGLALITNQRFRLLDKEQPEKGFNQMNLGHWFHKQDEKEKSMVKKPYLLPNQTKGHRNYMCVRRQ